MLLLLYHLKQVLSVLVLKHWLGEFPHSVLVNPSLAECDSLKARYLQPLPFLDHLHKCGSLGERIVGAGVQPCEPSSQSLYFKLPILKEHLVDGSYFIFSTSGWFDGSGHFNHIIRIEIQPRDGIIALRLCGLLLYAEAVAMLVKFRYAISLRIIYPVPEYSRLAILFGGIDGLLEHRSEEAAVEYVVTQYQTDRVFADEVSPDGERLRQSVRRRLFRILKVNSIVRPIAKKPLESRQVEWCGNDEDVPDPGKHKHADRVINHRFVINRHQLLADALGDRVQSRTAASG